MERYFPKAPPIIKTQAKKNSRYQPYKYQSPPQEIEEQGASSQWPKHNITFKELNRGLIRSLTDASNPITHSDAKDRADRAVSVSTGHQVAEEPFNRGLYLRDREAKLQVQHNITCNSNSVLRSVRVYISGYLNGTTDIEMRRVIAEAGGQTVLVPSQCTHIVTSQWLSGSKTHRLLTTKMHRKPYIVRPEWVFESIAAGRRQPERSYSIATPNGHKPLLTQGLHS